MATINSKQLFTFTSPRTPDKMIPEIALLAANFSGQKWDSDTQQAFTLMLREADFYEGSGRKDPAFSARDRINRAPKALGFVRLEPTVSLTEAGKICDLAVAQRSDPSAAAEISVSIAFS